MTAQSQNGTARRASVGGYIMIETVVALVLLSVGAYAVHGTLRQAILTRGQAEDYTQVRFALQQLVSDLELQPILKEEERSGRFPGDLERFAWRYTISRVALPLPPEVLALPPPQREFAYPKGLDFLTRVHVTIDWTRGGQPFSESFETLLAPSRLFQPPEPTE